MSMKNGVVAILHTFLRSHDSSAEDHSLSSFCHVLMFWQWFFSSSPILFVCFQRLTWCKTSSYLLTLFAFFSLSMILMKQTCFMFTGCTCTHTVTDICIIFVATFWYSRRDLNALAFICFPKHPGQSLFSARKQKWTKIDSNSII